MSDLLLLLIGLFVTMLTGVGILAVAYQDAVDRRREGKGINSPIDEKLVSMVGRE
jgi:hypothetical protein